MAGDDVAREQRAVREREEVRERLAGESHVGEQRDADDGDGERVVSTQALPFGFA
jgi:hypothetical protein